MIDHIDHGLHITSIEALERSGTGRYDFIISVCQDTSPDNVSDETPYRHFVLADDAESAARWGGSYDYRTFRYAAETALMALRSPEFENVLVHCHVGKNRSAAVCTAAIGVYDDSTYPEAFETVQRARPMVDPNDIMRGHAHRFIVERT